MAAELNAGVPRDGNFEVELQNEVAVFFFVNEEGVVRRVRDAFADNFAVFDLIFRRTAVFGPTVERFAVENRNEAFFDVRRLSRRDREATDRRQQRGDAAEQFAHFFVLINKGGSKSGEKLDGAALAALLSQGAKRSETRRRKRRKRAVRFRRLLV